MKRKAAAVLLTAVMLCGAACLGGCSQQWDGNPDKVKLDPEKPVTITVWNYYNGDQLDAFNELVSEFNDTEGREKGILVEGFSLGGVLDLENSVLDAARGKVGASKIPNLFAAYADTAFAVDKMGLAVDLSPYFTKKELGRFVDSYLAEGHFYDDGALKIFPVAKSTEIFMLNKTDWDKFVDATGWSVSDLQTIEGVTRTAEAYYNWTDSLTPEPNDGKAFFGRDAMANYILVGSMELGSEIFSVKNGEAELHFERDIMKRIWDNYYIPYIKGYFAASGRFRSADIKTGTVISFVGACSGATFFPDQVRSSDTESYPIELQVMACPQFEGGEKYAVQQGAGVVVTKSTPEEMYASVCFLKWFTQDSRNIKFSMASGYMPVSKEANDMEMVRENLDLGDDLMDSILTVAIDTVNRNVCYTPKAFVNGTSARSILETSLSNKAEADREAVVQNLKSGMSLKEATAAFAEEENFDEWYETTKAELEKLMDR